MTDYFALLGQPRSPWLDLDELKQAYHSRSLRFHPDRQATGADAADAAFAHLNDGYQALRDPKRRLQHLLALEGEAGDSRTVPPEIAALFPRVAEITQQAQQLPQQYANATSPLTRALLKPQLTIVQQRLAETMEVLRGWHSENNAALQHLASRWEQDRAGTLAELHGLYLRYSYIGRWTAELEERQLQLSAL